MSEQMRRKFVFPGNALHIRRAERRNPRQTAMTTQRPTQADGALRENGSEK
jgi:hypothetical protein